MLMRITNWMVVVGVLLSAAPLFAQAAVRRAEPRVVAGNLRWFTLRETPTVLRQALGAPAMVAESGPALIAWQYRLADDVEHEDFSHQFLFDRDTRRLMCVTRNYELERDVSALFPARQTQLHFFPNAEAPRMALRVRTLPGGLVLTALGAAGASSQVVLMRQEMMPVLFPWVRQ
jgi:hypothetical protein